MENGRKEVAARFAKVLRQKLTERFGDMPSAGRVANHFNLRAHGAGTITTEAARRWINGLSVPELARFRVLSEWLGVDTSDFLELGTKVKSRPVDVPAGESSLLGKLHALNEADLLSYALSKNELGDSEEKNFLKLYNMLNASQRHGILIAVWALVREQKNVSESARPY
jgi:hypothetical protein